MSKEIMSKTELREKNPFSDCSDRLFCVWWIKWTVFYEGIHVIQKLLNRLSITHDHPLRKHCTSSDPLTPPQGRLTGVKLG